MIIDSAGNVCERARRDAGFPARIHCRICARGPCGRKADDLTHMTAQVPNRLFGATINHEGDVV